MRIRKSSRVLKRRASPGVSRVPARDSPSIRNPSLLFRPNVMEDECRNRQTEENTNNTIPKMGEISVRRVAVKTWKEAVIEGEGYLQTRVCDSFGSCRDPSGDRRDARDYDDQRGDGFHVRDEEDNGDECEQRANDAAHDSKSAFAQGGFSASKRDKDARDKGGVNAIPINPRIKKITDHRGERALECEPDMGWIRKRIRHEQAFRFGTMCGRARRRR